jgi:perosamine synthetase
MSSIRIPVYRPSLGNLERTYLLDAFDSGWISSRGEYVGRFERAFAEFVGSPYATSVCNGTVALHLALVALGIGPGDEVIVPSLTYVASVNTIVQVGATPVLADSLRDSWQVDPADVERRITARTRAIMAVHLYGQPSDMDALERIAHRHDLLIVEDCAEAFGARIGDRHVGTFGDAATYSFFGNKTLTTGEGGMVVARDEKVMQRMTLLKNQGVSPTREYWHDEPAYNYRMTNLAAAIGLAQLERAPELLRRKRDLADRYRELLGGLPVELHAEQSGTVHSFWMIGMLVDTPQRRDPLRRALARQGIETRPLFHPSHTLPMHARFGHGDYEVAEDLASRGINLPSWPELADDELRTVCEALRGELTRQ